MVPDRHTALALPGRRHRPLSARGGFALLELLIVVVLIFVLTTLFLTNGSNAFQARKKVECAAQLQLAHVALKTYALDNHDQLPLVPGARTAEEPLSLLIPRATTGTAVFICPGSKDAPLPDAQPFAKKRISYAYYMGRTLADGADQPLLTDRQVNTLPKPAGAPLFSPDGKGPGKNHARYGGNVLFCDGSAQPSPPAAAFVLTNPPNVILLNPQP